MTIASLARSLGAIGTATKATIVLPSRESHRRTGQNTSSSSLFQFTPGARRWRDAVCGSPPPIFLSFIRHWSALLTALFENPPPNPLILTVLVHNIFPKRPGLSSVMAGFIRGSGRAIFSRFSLPSAMIGTGDGRRATVSNATMMEKIRHGYFASCLFVAALLPRGLCYEIPSKGGALCRREAVVRGLLGGAAFLSSTTTDNVASAYSGVISSKACTAGTGEGCDDMSSGNEFIRSLQEKSAANREKNQKVRS